MALALVIAYCILALLAVLALLWSGWPRWMKGLLVVGVTVLYFWGHDTLHGVLGLASEDALPEQFVMVAAMIEEPTAQSHGALYLWVRPMREGLAAKAPRAYRLAYSRALHEQINEGLKKGRDGISQMGTAEVKNGHGRGPGWLLPARDEQEVKISDLPLPQLPEK